MFPGPNASVYYNEAGEPMGWDNNYYDEPPEPDWDAIAAGEQAWEAGYEDGMHGAPSQVAKPGDRQDRAYLEGYGEGQRDRSAADEA